MTRSERLKGRSEVSGVEGKTSSMTTTEVKSLREQNAVNVEKERKYSKSSTGNPGSLEDLKKVGTPASLDRLKSHVNGSATILMNNGTTRVITENKNSMIPEIVGMILEIVTTVMKKSLIVADDTTGRITIMMNLTDFTMSVPKCVSGPNDRSVTKKSSNLNPKKNLHQLLVTQKRVNSKLLKIK
jgi:hypothetical protein